MLSPKRFFKLCALLQLAQAVTIGPVADLVVKNAFIAPDGYNRSGVLAGGVFPGPVITGKKGDRFKIKVINELTNKTMLRATSIHWHGIFQHGTSYADGAAMVTQCPIIPNESFQYDFPSFHQVGTYWYHSHYSTQYCDGLRGAFVIYDPDDPFKDSYDVDNESTIITLADWYHEPAPLRTQRPVATLINGLGRSVNGTATKLAVINVEKGKRYRFRVIGLSCDPSFNFTIHHHQMTVIEADGEYTTPLVVDSMEVWAGQRYSVIVKADQEIDNYWIRADPWFTRGRPGFDGGRNSAIFRYKGAPNVEPKTTFISTKPLKEVNLHALYNATPPGKPHPGGADLVIPIKHAIFHDPNPRFEVNNVTMKPPSVPIFLQVMNGTFNAADLMPKGAVYKLPPNKVIELVIYGSGAVDGGPHPWHLHGHSFWVVRSGNSTDYNFVNPVRRDTVDTGFDDGRTTIRFVTDNAGPWFLHCHIDWHLEIGLAVVFAEDPEGMVKQNQTLPPPYRELCPKFYKNDPDNGNHTEYPE
ncbi:Laccase-4 [Termitomyces sp. T112]|nr:Laccase-4 [Termitomyces sp. T112]